MKLLKFKRSIFLLKGRRNFLYIPKDPKRVCIAFDLETLERLKEKVQIQKLGPDSSWTLPNGIAEFGEWLSQEFHAFDMEKREDKIEGFTLIRQVGRGKFVVG